MPKYLIIILLFFSTTVYAFNDKEYASTSCDIHMDYVAWKGDKSRVFSAGFFFKEVNIHFKTKKKHDFFCFLNFKFSSQKLEYLIKEAYINIQKKNINIKFGKMYPFYDLEECTAPINRLFIEKCSLQGFEEYSLFGIMLNVKANLVNIFYYLLTPELQAYQETTYINKISSFLRCFVNINNKDNTYHFGFNYKEIIRQQNEDKPYNLVSITDIPAFPRPYNHSRTHYSSLPSYRVAGYEFIGILNSLTIQGEMLFSRAAWKDFDVELYKSINLQLGYILTGEKHTYDFNSGTIKNPTPSTEIGALELTMRYSLNDTTSKNALISGICSTDAIKHTVNIGFNWYLDNTIKIQTNYTYESFIYRFIDDKEIHSLSLGLRFSF